MSARANRRLIAEWESQAGVLLAWPHPDSDWGPILDAIERVYTELTTAIARHEPVVIVCRDRTHRDRVRARLAGQAAASAPVSIVTLTYNDTWIRDYGPLSIEHQGVPQLINFAFNGWGERYEAGQDRRVAERLHGLGVFGGTPMRSVDDWVLEAGSIDTDGRGTLLTTASCLLADNRNGRADRHRVEQRVGRPLGIERILWLDGGGLTGDDTDGHVDTLARFCDPATIAYATALHPRDEHYEPLRAMAAQLRGFRRPDGQPYRLVPLPLPRPIRSPIGERLPASYANFLIVNGAVVVPGYGDPMDQTARTALGACFPDREVLTLDALPLIQERGSIHCASMQVAAGIPLAGPRWQTMDASD